MARFGRRCACCRQSRWQQSARYRLVLPPGTYSTTPGWASREHWLAVVLPTATARGRDVLRRHHIAPDTFARIAALHAVHADDTTGRGCTIDVEHLRLEAGCSERTVQRARAAARELGIAVEVFRGRHLTLLERIDAYGRGSKQRGLVSVYALGIPRWLARHLPQRLTPVAAYPQVKRRVGERGTPPIGIPSGSFPLQKSRRSSATSAEELAALDRHDAREGSCGEHNGPSDPAPPAHRPAPRRGRGGGALPRPGAGHGQRPSARAGGPARPVVDPRARRLAEQVRHQVPALYGVALGRLIPAHHRFATSPTPWSAEQLVAFAYRAARVKGWTTNPGRVRYPAAWWAHLLQNIADTDLADLPAPRSAGGYGPEPAGWNPSPTTKERPTSSPPRNLEVRPARRATLWEQHERADHVKSASREREALVQRQAEERAEREGRDLCPHGVGGATSANQGRSTRCAHCRHAEPEA